MNPYWSYLLTAVGVLGLYLAGRKSYWGWGVGLGAQGLWIAYAYATSQPGFYLSALAYGSVYARNFYQWRKERRDAETYGRRVSAPMSEATAKAIGERLRSGTAPRRKVAALKFCDCGNYAGEHPFPGCPGKRPDECSASVSGRCLNEAEGDVACDTDQGECVRFDRPAERRCGWFTDPNGKRRHGVEQGPPGSTDFKSCVDTP